MHLAAELGFIESAEVLLNNGADLSLCERSGRSALYVAARGSYPALVDLLIRAQRVRQHRAGSVVSLQSTGFASRKCSLERNTSLDSTDTHRTYLANEPETDRVLSRQPSQQSNAGNELLLDLSLQPNSTVLTTTTATTAQQEEATVQPILTQQLLIKQQVLWQQQQFNQSKQMRDMLNTVARQYLDNDDWKRLARHWQFPDEHIRAIEHQYTGRSSFKEHGHRLLLIWLHSLPPHQHALRELLLALRCIQRSDLADRVRKRLADDSLLLPATTHSLTRSTSDGLHSATGSYAEESVRPDARFGLSHLLSSELSDSLKVGRALNRLLASLLNVRRRRRCDCLPADQEACGYCCIS